MVEGKGWVEEIEKNYPALDRLHQNLKASIYII
jgi:hypothetical protein